MVGVYHSNHNSLTRRFGISCKKYGKTNFFLSFPKKEIAKEELP